MLTQPWAQMASTGRDPLDRSRDLGATKITTRSARSRKTWRLGLTLAVKDPFSSDPNVGLIGPLEDHAALSWTGNGVYLASLKVEAQFCCVHEPSQGEHQQPGPKSGLRPDCQLRGGVQNGAPAHENAPYRKPPRRCQPKVSSYVKPGSVKQSMIDSHAHVSTARFDEDRDEVLARAWSAGLTALVDVGCDLASSRASVALAQQQARVWATVGVHPHEAKHWTEDTADALLALAQDANVVAWGEIGLDFHYTHSPPDTQRAVFRAQAELALELELPVVLHLREAYDQALTILDETGVSGRPRPGVAHCFTGTAAQAQAFVERGFGRVLYRSGDV